MAESLSGDALQLVFSYLGRLAELHQCRCVCKLWRTAAEAIGPRLDFFYERPLLRFYSETMRQLIEQELRNLATLHEAERHGFFGYLLNESRPNQYSTSGEALLGSLCTTIRRQSPHHMMLQGLMIPNVTGGFEPSSRWTVELEGLMCLEQASAPDFWHYRNIQLHILRESEKRPALFVVYRVHDRAGFVVVTDFLRDHCPVGQGRVVIVGTCPRSPERQVSYQEGADLARLYGGCFCEVGCRVSVDSRTDKENRCQSCLGQHPYWPSDLSLELMALCGVDDRMLPELSRRAGETSSCCCIL
jgi:hypothetical protein